MDPSIRALLGALTVEIDALMRQDLANIDNPLLHQVIDYALFKGGKRLRPALTVLSHDLCRSDKAPDQRRLHTVALCFEYTHTASLLHDDVIDWASQRRGCKSANKIWGNTNVILAGDFLHARALFLAATHGGIECLEIISKAVEAMVRAEYLQLENTASQNLSDTFYYQVLQGKTAMLISAACETGCIVATASREQRQAARTFGTSLGLAFQIVDDALDYAGDPDKTGKAIGNDWREQRMTLPLILTLDRVNAVDRAWLLAQFAAPRAVRARAFVEVAGLIEQAGGVRQALARARQLIDEAIAALAVFPDSEAKDTLIALSRYVLQRES